MSKTVTTPEIRDIGFAEALGERYLAYALSTITSRSLPDVRDGLKPVHRRLLYAMRELNLDPGAGYKKCARIVGDVIGKYHPHGDVAVYEALVRLAQPFAIRYPLIDGQGNFGSVDGDNAAAMRYTEARLTEVSKLILDGIDEDAIDFRATYDGEASEPVVLPASFPNLLANGAAGIAVGMATNIPPHNVDEIAAALLHLIRFPKATVAKLVSLMPGPDFPSGGILVEAPANILEAYTTGRGSFRLRARWQVETLARGTYQILVTEIPYQVPKARLIQKIADMLQAKTLPLLENIRDESDEKIRLILEPRNRNVDPAVLMESLFRKTDLEIRVGLNLNVLDGTGVPRVMDLREVLQAFLDHRHDVLLRRTHFRLAKIEERLEILKGYCIVYLNLDKIIAILRGEEAPKPPLMKAFKLSDFQAEAILNMRLRALRRLEEKRIQEEFDRLSAEEKILRKRLKDKAIRWQVIADEVAQLRKQFSKKTPLGRRQTSFETAPDDIDLNLETMIEKEPITILCSEKGWIRTVKGHVAGEKGVKYKEGDGPKFEIHAETTDKLLIFASNGRFYTLAADRLPRGRGHGEPVRLLVDLGNEDDIVTLFVHDPGARLLVASSDGRGFVVKEEAVIAQTRAGKQVLNVANGVTAHVCVRIAGDHVAVVGENRKLLIFPLDDLPEMGRGRGNMLQRYQKGGLSDVTTFVGKEGLHWKIGERTRIETDIEAWMGKRGAAGRVVPKGFSKANRFR
ncbi:MAG: DNA topoisomerase IV subunit A [Rhodospirillaceae bacterium]|nr:MAG: DNA topoisomerase IV subunit A [Rhodospirillaceae bacterium]